MIKFVVSTAELPFVNRRWWDDFSDYAWKLPCNAWESLPNSSISYHDIRNKELKKYGGKFYRTKNGSKYVSFKNDIDASFFMMRWQ